MESPGRLALFITLAVLSQSIAFSQKLLRPGYVVTHSGDTIRGQIVLNVDNSRFESCSFVRGGSDSKTYLPSDLIGYGFSGGGAYVSKPLPLNISAATNTFSELLVGGRANLVSAYDRLFIDTGNEGIQELLQSKEVVYKDGVAYVQTVKKYQTTLKLALVGCPGVESMIGRTGFTIKSLSKVIKRYNECFPDKPVVVSKRQKVLKVRAGIVAAYSFVQFDRFDKTTLESSVDANQFTDRIFYPGIAVEVTSPELIKNLGIHLDLFYQKNSLQSFFKSDNIYKTASWRYQSVNTPLTIVYSYSTRDNFRFFVEGGISPYLTLNTETSYREDTESGNSIELNTNENSELGIDNQFTILFIGGTGMSYRLIPQADLSLKLRYETGSFNINSYHAIHRNNFTIAASLLFKISK